MTAPWVRYNRTEWLSALQNNDNNFRVSRWNQNENVRFTHDYVAMATSLYAHNGLFIYFKLRKYK